MGLEQDTLKPYKELLSSLIDQVGLACQEPLVGGMTAASVCLSYQVCRQIWQLPDRLLSGAPRPKVLVHPRKCFTEWRATISHAGHRLC
jgi:hypothetical protein